MFQDEVSSPSQYTSALSSVECATNTTNSRNSEVIEIYGRPLSNEFLNRTLSLGSNQKNRFRNPQNPNRLLKDNKTINTISSGRSCRRDEHRYTADDVISLFRSSTRPSAANQESNALHHEAGTVFNSIDNLVLNAEPPGESSSAAAALNTNNYVSNNTSII